ncbi:MAG: N-acetylmuramoyl-L-alanine amidase [Luteolibacter sp.]
MIPSPKSLVPLLMAGSLVAIAVVLWIWQVGQEVGPQEIETAEAEAAVISPNLSDSLVLAPTIEEPADAPDEPSPLIAPPTPPLELPRLSVLAEPPDWESLEIYQNTITRRDFERLLTDIFTTSDFWRNYIMVDDEQAVVRTHASDVEEAFALRFAASEDDAASVPRIWQPGAKLAPAPEDRPLDGLHIAIDPGHIGGEWAKMEERWFSLNGEPAVTEGDMTLKVARMLKPELEKLGARVTLVRDKPEPITPMRPEMLLEIAAEQSDTSPAAMQRLAERLFYRTAEIRARAHIVNHAIQPDLVLCLHFNAEAWGNPARPKLVDQTHFHLLLNGGYTDSEVALADQRFAMLKKLLQRTHEEEALVGATVADVFAEASGLPPYTYTANAPNVRPVNDHPFLWARNLLANRLYDCPVIFMEPYVMNSKHDYARIQAGDYDGLREINGRLVPSIYREYVDALTDGLAQHYRAIRGVLE